MGDTWKKEEDSERLIFCGVSFKQWLNSRGIREQDVWTRDAERGDLLRARLFTVGQELKEALCFFLRNPENPDACGSLFRSRERVSLFEANTLTNVTERESERIANRAAALSSLIVNGRGFRNLSAADFLAAFPGEGLPPPIMSLFDKTDDPLLKAIRGEILSRHGEPVRDSAERLPMCFVGKTLRKPLRISVKEDQIVWARAPIRLDLAGGWSDTPPYTNRFGGAVVNVACNLNGQDPIQVFVRRTKERHIRIHSIDLGLSETITETAGILDYNNPESPFALPKAALALLGMEGMRGTDTDGLGSWLSGLGGGLEITLLCAVPKGSGLGTSSILGAVILGALYRFLGINADRNELFLGVLEMEQMLTTGGGWQDQIGGAVGGLKYIETKPSLRPDPIIHQLDSFLFEDPACMRQMTLFYTGITRLAKHILKDVVNEVNANTPAYLFTHDRLKNLAEEAREVVSLRDIRGLGRVVSESFKANKLIHPSTTNPDMEVLVRETAPYCLGMKLLGAGGGGFGYFISPDEKAADSLRSLLRRKFENERARLVDFSLNKYGMEVTVS